MKILQKKVGSDIEILSTERKYICDCISDHISDKVFAQRIKIDDNIILVCDEEGIFKNLPANFYLPFFYPESIRVTPIRGDVLFIKQSKNYNMGEIYDYEVEDLTEEDIFKIEAILHEDIQKKLKNICEKQKK